jgi:hypothetical protein
MNSFSRPKFVGEASHLGRFWGSINWAIYRWVRLFTFGVVLSVATLSQLSAQTSSVNGSFISGPTSKTLTDANGHVFSFAGLAGSSGKDYLILRDGKSYAAGMGETMVLNNGIIWVYNSSNQWWADNGQSFDWEPSPPASWSSATPAPTPAATPAVTPTPTVSPTSTSSANGASISGPTTQTLTDANGHVFSFGGLAGSSGKDYLILRDGKPYAAGMGETMVLNNGVIWVYNSSNQWWADNGQNFNWEPSAPPSWGSPVAPVQTSPPASPPSVSSNPSAPPPTTKAGTDNCLNFANPPAMPIASPNGLGDEFVGPLPGWSNLKTTFGASGNGATDDTAAIQRALNSLSASGSSPTLYVPPGVYLVTQTLTVQAANSISVLGADPSTTSFVWKGVAGGTLLHVNGVAYSRFNRLTFEGSNTANILIDQSSATSCVGCFFDTGNEYADDVFQNAQIGIQGGANGGASETSVLRDKFLNLKSDGILLRNFNALDWWVWNSYFKNDAVGVSNIPGAGNFHVFNSYFDSSTVADLQLLNTGQFSFRDNFSIDSNRFLFEGFYYTNSAATRLQGNTIVMPTVRPDGYSDYVGNTVGQGNMGPTIMSDNVFLAPANAGSHPAVEIYGQYWPDCVSIGNTYTNNNTVTCLGTSPDTGAWTSSNMNMSVDDKVVAPSEVTYKAPPIPSALPNYARKIFAVSAGASAAQVQQAINSAAAYCGQRPVVYLPYGGYFFNTTVTIPANCNLQVVGDGAQTFINWTGSGSGPVFLLQGPSQAILRDFYVRAAANNGTPASGIVIQNADQPGSRIFLQEPQLIGNSIAGLFVDGLDNAYVELDDAQIAGAGNGSATQGVGLQVIGGPSAQSGNPLGGRTALLAGSGNNNFQTLQVSKGGSLIAREFWFEDLAPATYAAVSDNSMFTLEGSRLAVEGNNGAPSVQVSNLSCAATFLDNAPDSNFAFTNGNNGSSWVLGNNFGLSPSFESGITNGLTGAFSYNRSFNNSQGSIAIADLGDTPSDSFTRTSLAQSRATHPSTISDLQSGLTDVRIYRVWINLGSYGIHVER